MQNIRDVLFGDAPLGEWPSEDLPGEPWATFVAARQALAAGRKAEAIEFWERITKMPDLGSRHYLQAWHFLRAQGIQPHEEDAKKLLGVVVEVGMKEGLDLLVGYADHHARYFNFSGAAVIWEHPNTSVDSYIDALLAAGLRILQRIGPWTDPRPPAPPADQIRINLLAPSGLHFGEGAMRSFPADPLAKPAFDAAVVLMQQLIAQSKHSSRAK